MPISSTTRKAGPFYGNGAATTFTFDFKIFEPSELRVVRFSSALGVDLDLVAGVDYSITLNPDQDEAPGGEVILAVAPAIGDRVVLLSDVPDTQPVDLTNQGGFYPDLLNGGLDRTTILVQQLREKLGRAIKLPPTAEDGEYVLPLPQGNQLLAWGQDGKTITNLDPGELISVVTYGNTKADVFEGDGTSTAFALSASPGSVNNLAISIDGVVQVPEIDYAWGGGKSLVFLVAPPAGTRVFVRYQEALDEGADVSGKADKSGGNLTPTDAASFRKALASPTFSSLPTFQSFQDTLATDARSRVSQVNPLYPGLGGGDFLPIPNQPFYGIATITNGGSGYTDGKHNLPLTTGGGTGAIVQAEVLSGRVITVRWAAPGTGYTSPPSFPWASLPGSGTPGNITLSLADGGVYVRTAANQVWARAEFLADGVVRPEWFGAIGNQTGNDGPALSSASAFVRTSGGFSGDTMHKIVLRGNARYNLLSGWDLTNFRTQCLVIEANGALLHGRFAGTMMDLTYTRNVQCSNLRIYGDATTTPEYGIAFSLYDKESTPWNEFDNLNITGFFSKACLYNFGSEFLSLRNSSITNSRAAGGYSMILDPINSEGFVSAFFPSVSATDFSVPMSEMRFFQSRFAADAGDAIKVTAPVQRCYFDQCYVVSRNGACVALYAPTGVFLTTTSYVNCLFDIRGEPRGSVGPNPVETMVRFYTRTSDAIVLDSCRFSDYGLDYSIGVLEKRGTGTVTIRGGDIRLGGGTYGGARIFYSSTPGVGFVYNGYVDSGSAGANQADFSHLSGFFGVLYSRFAFSALIKPPAYGFFHHPAGGAPSFHSSGNIWDTSITTRRPGGTIQREYSSSAGPEGNITATQGSMVWTTGERTGLWRKRSGTGSSGWVPAAYDQEDVPYVLARSFVAAPLTGTTGETTLATVTIPAGAMGANGFVKVRSFWSSTGAGGNKTPRVRFAGATYLSQVLTAALPSLVSETTIANRNSLTSQVGGPAAGTTLPSSSGLITTGANTAGDVAITLTGQLANSADTLTLEGYIIEVCRKP